MRFYSVVGTVLIALITLTVPIPAQVQCDQGSCTTLLSTNSSQLVNGQLTASNLAFFKNFFVAGDYAVAGIGLRGSGVGTISMIGVPPGATIVAAYVYWETLGNGRNGAFNGISVSGVPLGTVTSPCWAIPLITVYRADVLRYLNAGGNGSYQVSFPDSRNFSIAPSTEGATLVVVYQKVGLPTKAVVFYDGAYTLRGETPTFNLTIQNFTQTASVSPQVKLTHVVGDGQPFEDTLFFNGTILGNPRIAFGGLLGSLWDSPTFDVSNLVAPNASSMTTSVSWPVGPNPKDCLTWGAVILSTTIQGTQGGGSVDLIDPISELLSGSSVILPDTSAHLTTLATRGIPRGGVATDGVAKLVARFNAPGPGSIQFYLTDENGGIVSNGDENGRLTDLFGSPLSGAVSMPVLQVGSGQYKAFALYTAPTQFVRNGFPDAGTNQRRVLIQTHFIPSAGQPTDTAAPVNIVRPPIILVHGLWELESDWANLFPASSRDCTDSGKYYTCRIDYRDHNADKFAVIAPIVGNQIRDDISKFKSAKNVAAIQANVIGHSMGGLIPRVLPLCGPSLAFKDCSFSYLTLSNFNAGDINRLVTIGTPHQGSALADHLWPNRNTPCPFSLIFGNLGQNFAAAGNPIGGGVEDLQTTSGAISGLNGNTSPFFLSFFVGIANSNDETLFNNGLIKAVRGCSNSIVPANVRDVFGQDSDLIVSVASQSYGLADGATGTTRYTPTIHSQGAVWKNQTGFSTDEYHLTVLANDAIQALDTGQFIRK